MKYKTKQTLLEIIYWCLTWIGFATSIGAGIVLGKFLEHWIFILFIL